MVWFCLDYLSDFLYLADILFHFRTGYLEDGVLQTDATKLRTHYMNSTTFYIDCLCLLPLDCLYLSIGFNSILRSFRLVKIYRLVYYKSFISNSYAMSRKFFSLKFNIFVFSLFFPSQIFMFIR